MVSAFIRVLPIRVYTVFPSEIWEKTWTLKVSENL